MKPRRFKYCFYRIHPYDEKSIEPLLETDSKFEMKMYIDLIGVKMTGFHCYEWYSSIEYH